MHSANVCDCVTHVNVWSPDDDIDLNNLPDDELDVYFSKLVPPAMQRGRVEGQEIPVTVRLLCPFKPVDCVYATCACSHCHHSLNNLLCEH